jgi:hypothetical protein
MENLVDDVVSFYLPERAALQSVDPLTLDPDRDWAIFGAGVYVWILQTFLRLRAAGAPVRLVDVPPSAGLIVVHADYLERLLSEAPSPTALTIVCARSDKPPQLLADAEVVQTASAVEEDYQYFIPSWLQPGLIPRSPSRGTRVEEIAYVGAKVELHDDLVNAEWAELLHERGLHWDARMIATVRSNQLYSQLRWHDYSDTDVVVALRPSKAWIRRDRSKPAAKLQNAWAAGVPAILSPEIAYRELRRSELDYLEAASAVDVLSALDRLRRDPELYAAMVHNGLQRAQEFRPDRLAVRWIDVLWGKAAERARRPRHRVLANMRSYRALARRLRRRWRASVRG